MREGGFMAGFTDLLGTLIQEGLSKSGTKRLSSVFGQGGGSIGDVVDGLGKVLGGKTSPSLSGLGGILGSVLKNVGSNKSMLGGLGALGGALLGGGKRSAKGAVGGGLLTMLASLAFSALKKTGQNPVRPLVALQGPETPEQENELEEDAKVIVKAMINAAKADGGIDQKEMGKIIGKFNEGGFSQEEKDFFLSESSRPCDLQAVVESASERLELGAQVYAASLLAIDVDTEAERTYVKELAKGLGLDGKTVEYIEKSLGK